MKRRYYAERLLTDAGLFWACYSDEGTVNGFTRRLEQVFTGADAEARARGHAEMLERTSCPLP